MLQLRVVDSAFHHTIQVINGPANRLFHNQIAPQFGTSGAGDVVAADPSHRHLWGPAVDQLLADESVDSLESQGDSRWAFNDHLNSVRDLAVYTGGETPITTIIARRDFDAFGVLVAESTPPRAIQLLQQRMRSPRGHCWRTGRYRNHPTTGNRQFAEREPVVREIVAERQASAVPPWMPAKQWEPFDGDHFLIAGDMSEVRQVANSVIEHGPGETGVVLSMFSPVWESSRNGVAGMRIGAELVLHAAVEADNEKGAEKIEKTAESLRVLGLNAIDVLEKKLTPAEGSFSKMKDILVPVLTELKIVRAGVMVEAKTSVSFETIQKLRPVVVSAQKSAQQTQSSNKLKQFALGMLNYESAKRHFPPAVLYGPDGKTPYSWRVELLPYFDEKALYDQYHFDEPWDSANNRKVLDQMPAVYRSAADAEDSKNTSYFVLTGPQTVFEGKDGLPISKIVDGLSQTILVVETKRDVPWTKPEDIPYEADKPIPDLHGNYDGKYHVVMADGSVHISLRKI